MKRESDQQAVRAWARKALEAWRNRSANKAPKKAVRKAAAQMQYGKLEQRQAMATIPMGGILDGTIAGSGETDVHQFQVSTASRIEIGLQASGQQGFYCRAQVYAPNGLLLGTLIANTGISNRTFEVAQAGTCTVKVFDDNLTQTGNYGLGLEGIRPASPDATSLVKGGIVSGTIGRNLERDQWTFSGNSGDKVEIAITGTATQAGYLAIGRLLSPSGTFITQFTSNTTTAGQPVSLPETGTYVLQMSDSDMLESGNYTIGLEGLRPISPNPIVLPRGSVLSGSINSALDKVQYVFEGQANGIYELAITSSAIDAGYQAQAKLFDASGTLLRVLNANADGAQRFRLTTTGTFMIQVNDVNLVKRGNYSIGLEGISPISVNPINLPKGSVTTSYNAGLLDKKQFTFSGVAGQIVDLAISRIDGQVGYVPYGQLFTPAGDLVVDLLAGSWRSWRRVMLPVSGTYMLQVCDDTLFQAGAYKLSFEGITPASPDATTPAQNAIVSRTTVDNMQREQFLIPRTIGQTFSVDLRKVSEGSNFLPRYSVISARGMIVGGDLAGTVRSFTAEENGTYLIMIYDDQFDGIGSYTFRWF